MYIRLIKHGPKHVVHKLYNNNRIQIKRS